MRPFRFGVSIWAAGSKAEWAEKARKAEDLGYQAFTVPDHLSGPFFAPMPALVGAAEATRTLRVGTYVLNNDFWNPVLLAREAATIGLLTEGRLELGLGAGHKATEYDQAGLRFDAGRARVERLAESVAIVKRLLDGEQMSFAGEHFTVREAKLHERLVLKQRPPLLIAGHGKRLLTLAGREADIVAFAGFTHRRGGAEVDRTGFRAEALDTRVGWVRAAAGERFATLELNALVQHLSITDQPRAAADQVAAQWPGVDPTEILSLPFMLIGSVDGIVEALLRHRQRWGISYYTMSESTMETFAPIVARLTDR
ncbi:MAG: TIGR03621 family F420-dependent LLM class oxidoreductase [Chloroflexi bacterium]|nr:TIGR03621 family F420-dependent LLM class oxidoreductase [Chloroflexota bacterium]